MRSKDKVSLMSRLLGRNQKSAPAADDATEAEREALIQAANIAPDATRELPSGSVLEQAYRELLMENQVLVESNKRLHERLARRDSGVEESPATRELIRAQRNALAERSHRLREVEYENKQLKREQEKVFEENRRLSASLAKHMQDIQPLLRKEELNRIELAQAREKLRKKTGELVTLTDKYYQLEARSKPPPPPNSAANGDYEPREAGG